MSKFIDRATEKRNNPFVHYNCAQSILCVFADETGLTEQQAIDLGSNFGSGMKCGSVCGAITAGLMVLGLKGFSDFETLSEFRKVMAEGHDGLTNCADLLRLSASKGIGKKEHCDNLVYTAVRFIENKINTTTEA